MGLSIRLLGRPEIIAGDGGDAPVRGQQAWAALARILMTERPLDRRQLAAELFPDTVDPLGSLRWCLASLRRAMGADVLTGDPIRPNLPNGTTVDAWSIGHAEYDVSHAGNLLEGIEPKASAGFSTWLLIERERIAVLIDERLRRDTLMALSAGDHMRAVRLAELAARRNPFDESAHVLLVRSLIAGGRADAALDHVEATEANFLIELGEKPTPALRSAARLTVAAPPCGVSSRAVIRSLMDAGKAAVAAGAADAGIDCLRRAAAGAEALGDDHVSAMALLELGTALIHGVRGQDDEGILFLLQATECARRCGAADIATRSLREQGYVEALAGRRPLAAGLLAQAMEANGGAPEGLAGIHSIVGFNLVDWGRIAEGIEHFEHALDYARTSADHRREAWSLGIAAWGHLANGRPDIAREWAQSCLERCANIGWLAFRPWPEVMLTEARLKLGGTAATLRADIEASFALSTQLRDPCWEAASARSMALIHASRHDEEVALCWLSQARQLCLRVTDPYAGLLVQIIADERDAAHRSGLAERTETLTRELIATSARTHADAHLRREIAAGAPDMADITALKA